MQDGDFFFPPSALPQLPLPFSRSLFFTFWAVFSISLSIFLSEHKAKKRSEADKKYFPGERQVWINKEEVYSALPEREGLRETWDFFFFLFSRHLSDFERTMNTGRRKVES